MSEGQPALATFFCREPELLFSSLYLSLIKVQLEIKSEADRAPFYKCNFSVHYKMRYCTHESGGDKEVTVADKQ